VTENVESQQTQTDSVEALRQPIDRVELIELGHQVLESVATLDLDDAVRQEIDLSGVMNPNQISDGIFLSGIKGKVPMRDRHVYRSVDRRAVDDLIATGIVRGAYTATDGARSSTAGHSTFWSKGRSDVGHQFASPGHFIFETPIENTEKGWVKGNALTGIYAKDKDGVIHNILEQSQ